MKRNTEDAVSGFTLAEVLVAMTLLGLVLVMMFSALHTTSRSWYLGEARALQNDEQRLVQAFLRRQFEQLVPLVQFDRRDSRVLFAGRSDRVIYTSRLPAHHAGAGIYLLGLVREDDTLQLKQLGLQQQINLTDSNPFADGSARSLLENITAVEFAYYGREEEDELPRWRDRWNVTDRLPELVRITIQQDHVDWPVLVVPVRTGVQRGQPQLALGTVVEDDD